MTSEKRRGTILITSLWILSILAILAVGIGLRVSIEARLAKNNMDRLKSLYLAKAGATQAIYRLSKSTNPYDSLYECGVTFSYEEKSNEDKLKSVFAGRLGGGVFSTGYKMGNKTCPGMSDEERKININTAPRVMLESLLGYVGEDQAIAAYIVEWRSPGVGLNDGYYESLPAPYKCKHERFSSLEELMLVKGIDQKIFDKIKDHITVFGNSGNLTVNINTAPKAILSIILMSGASINRPIDKTASDILADRIVMFRSGPDRESGTKDDVNFTGDISIEAILPELSTQAAEIKKYFTTKSSYFRIESEGTLDKSKIGRSVVCIVTKEQGKTPTLKSYREY
ncbi:MAG: type II secretion system protein GspK [Candidatus Omnitrophica bacterium]|nr:type II secretion system protein GspK [Candidatus Omnitrophota bacterium]